MASKFTPVEIFIAYSRKDTALLDEFRVHLRPLERAGKAHIWYDGKIEPGAVWEEAIKEHLHRSDIILLLVSADAIASDYFYEKEVADALERHRQGHARVVPMIMRPCAWNATPLAELQALPKNGKPLTTWPDRDEAFADATNSLLAMVNNIEQRRQEQAEQARLQKEAEENERLENERRLREAAELQQRAGQAAELARHAEQNRKEKEAQTRKQKEAAEQQKRTTDAANKKEKAAEAARRREAEAVLQKKNAAIVEKKRKEAEAANRQRQERLGRQLRMAGIAAGIVLGIFIVYKLASGPNKTPEVGSQLTPIVRKPVLTPLQKLEADMALITSGAFIMGCKNGLDADCNDWEKPAHEVRVSDFSIGRYEVTQAQWRAVMGSDPPELHNKGCDQCPVENVSWNDVQDFLKKLNTLTGKRYRLPTEAEWEYAARGGNQSKDYLYSGSNTIGEVAWYSVNAKLGNTNGAQKTTRPVGIKMPNELGLYDMSGNVWEWCEDDWHRNYIGAPTDGSAWVDSGRGPYRVYRGGGWGVSAPFCRVARRDDISPALRGDGLGFRLAL